MAKREFLAGATSQTCDIFIQDSSSTTGAGLSGLVFNTANLKAYYRKGATGSATAITLATQTVGGAWSSGGFVEIDATNMKGMYRFDIPDTVLASTPWADLYFYGATNMAPVPVELAIVSFNPYDGVRLGLTALPNAAAEAAGGLYTRGTGAGQINQANNGQVDVNAVRMNGTTLTARDIGASVLLSSGTGTGQLKLASGYVAMTWADIAAPTTAVNLSGTSTKALEPTTAGRTLDVTATGAAGIDWNNVESQGATVNFTDTTVGAVTSVTQVDGDVIGNLGGSIVGNLLGGVAGTLSQLTAQNFAEPAGAPAASATLETKIGFIYEILRNKLTVSSTAITFFSDAGASQWSKALSDDGTTYTEAEGA